MINGCLSVKWSVNWRNLKKEDKREMKVKIYTIFLPCYSSQKDNLLGRLQNELDDVEFVGSDELSGIMATEGRRKAYQNIRNMKDELDGVLVFGGYLDREITSFGLPVIMVRSLFGVGDWEKGILNFYKGEKVLTACLSDFDISSRSSASRLDDLFNKIKLISALRKVKESRLLVVQEPEIFGNYDILGMDFHSPLPEDYNEVYLKNLKEMGPEVTHASLIELNDREDQ